MPSPDLPRGAQASPSRRLPCTAQSSDRAVAHKGSSSARTVLPVYHAVRPSGEHYRGIVRPVNRQNPFSCRVTFVSPVDEPTKASLFTSPPRRTPLALALSQPHIGSAQRPSYSGYVTIMLRARDSPVYVSPSYSPHSEIQLAGMQKKRSLESQSRLSLSTLTLNIWTRSAMPRHGRRLRFYHSLCQVSARRRSYAAFDGWPDQLPMVVSYFWQVSTRQLWPDRHIGRDHPRPSQTPTRSHIRWQIF